MIPMAQGCVVLILASVVRVFSAELGADLFRHPVTESQGNASHESIMGGGPRSLIQAVTSIKQTSRCEARADSVTDGEHMLVFGGLPRRYGILKPIDYIRGQPRDVLLLFHGFGEAPNETLKWFSGLRYVEDGPILVAPEGVSMKIGSHITLPAAFNGVGSSLGIGPKGEICASKPYALIYPSHQKTCGRSHHQCAWTSCADDVGFVLAVLNIVEASMCAQRRRVFVAGFSTGGQFVYDLATDPRSAGRLDAVATLQASPHRGFLRHAPPGAQPRFLGIWGGMNSSWQDYVIPPFTTPGLDPDTSMGSDSTGHNWYYSTAHNTTAFWGHHVDCQGASGLQQNASTNFLAAQALNRNISCLAMCNGRVVQCLRGDSPGATQHFFAHFYPSLVWNFFVK
mmetsp:Transcript_9764/g.17237  ORF Transcript_9764/g.17237 Transcript_9764/m.17237 type:complete len:397 (+) Transcript_9764:91-1281(+)